MSILTEALRIKQMISALTVNWTVDRLDDSTLQEIENGARSGDPILVRANADLLNALTAITQPEDYTAIAQAYEIFEEAFVYLLLKDRKLPLVRTPGTGGLNQKRPDFQCNHRLGTFFVEVKTLDFQDGSARHAAIANAGLESKAELDGKARKPGVHFGTPVVISPHRPGATVADRIETAIKKIKSNLKIEQVTFGPTILVVDLTRLSYDSGHASSLVPTYYDRKSRSCASGELWHIAFGEPNDLILVRAEFEGASNFDRRLRETGVYNDYPQLMALVFVSRSLQGNSMALALRKLAPDFSKVPNPLTEDQIGRILHEFCDATNDERNEGGYRKQLRL